MLSYLDGQPCSVGDVILVNTWRGRETADVERVDRDTITVAYRGPRRSVARRGIFDPRDESKRAALWRRA